LLRYRRLRTRAAGSQLIAAASNEHRADGAGWVILPSITYRCRFSNSPFFAITRGGKNDSR